MTITKPERKKLIRLLGKLQDRLEDSIDRAVAMPSPDALTRRALAQNRRNWNEAETLVKLLDKGRP